jgi:predicted nucleotidyltransferase component of viral defense system
VPFPQFDQQVRVLLSVLPHVMSEKKFALKGGTAINFFLRDMPRLSLDIDLTYLPIEERATSLATMSASLEAIAAKISSSLPGVRIQRDRDSVSKQIRTLLVHRAGVTIKVEPNQILRGSIFPCQEQDLCEGAQQSFAVFVTVNRLSVEDLYGGKICAALDRQHPRDLFDIKILVENEGITDRIRKTFVGYLAGHDRPIHELLDPARQDVRAVFEKDFVGMVTVPVKYEDLIDARETLVSKIRLGLTSPERQFLLSLKEGKPEWNLLGLVGIEKLPAIQWKLANIQKMKSRKHAEMLAKLRKVLDL